MYNVTVGRPKSDKINTTNVTIYLRAYPTVKMEELLVIYSIPAGAEVKAKPFTAWALRSALLPWPWNAMVHGARDWCSPGQRRSGSRENPPNERHVIGAGRVVTTQ